MKSYKSMVMDSRDSQVDQTVSTVKEYDAYNDQEVVATSRTDETVIAVPRQKLSNIRNMLLKGSNARSQLPGRATSIKSPYYVRSHIPDEPIMTERNNSRGRTQQDFIVEMHQ